jgi:hypothetical protein
MTAEVGANLIEKDQASAASSTASLGWGRSPGRSVVILSIFAFYFAVAWLLLKAFGRSKTLET